MPAQRHERYGVWDNFVRGCYLMLCLFVDVSLVGQVWVDTRVAWGGAGAAAALGVLAALALAEIWLYRQLWRDVRVSVTEANVSPTIIASEGDPVQIEILLHNDGLLDARGLSIEAVVNGRSVGKHTTDIQRDALRSVTLGWGATKGEHDLRIRIQPGVEQGRRRLFGRRSEGVEAFAGDFSIRLGKRVVSQKDVVGDPVLRGEPAAGTDSEETLTERQA